MIPLQNKPLIDWNISKTQGTAIIYPSFFHIKLKKYSQELDGPWAWGPIWQ